jgi:hypothetical protein
MYIPWSKRVYKDCPSIGSDTAETMVLHDYALWQEDIISDLRVHILNAFFDIDGVMCKRVCIKFPGIGSHRYRTVHRRPHESCMQ